MFLLDKLLSLRCTIVFCFDEFLSLPCRSGSDPQGNAASSFDPYFKAGAQSVICYATYVSPVVLSSFLSSSVFLASYLHSYLYLFS